MKTEAKLREHGNPRSTLRRDGYGTTPTQMQAYHAGRWRRVYVTVWGNAPTHWITVRRERVAVTPWPSLAVADVHGVVGVAR